MRRQNPEAEFLTAEQMSAALSLSRESIYRLAGQKDGPLQVVRFGRALRFPRRQLETLGAARVEDQGDEW